MTHDNTVFVQIWDLNEAPVEGPVSVKVEDRELVLLRRGDTLVAMDRWCPHQQGDMAAGRVVGRGLKCPLHGFIFSVDTGRGLNCPGFNLSVHDLNVKDGLVSVRLKH